MISSFSSECLLNIFENFLTGNNDLKNCILVNRNWSSLAISVLWKNPLTETLKVKQSISVITTYITCLPQESKDSLIANGLQLPEKVLRRELYDYPSHLQILNYQNLYDAIIDWIEESHQEDIMFHQYQLLDHIFRMFMVKCINIRRIDISNLDDSTKIIHFPLLPNSDEFLSNVKEFSCNGSRNSDFIYLLSQKCTQINSFHLKGQNNGLARLIDMQKVPIKSLEVDFRTMPILSIEKVIQKNSNSITKLKLTGSSRLFRIDCQNLKELVLDLNMDLVGLAKKFGVSIFPKLVKLDISIINLNLKFICKFLKNHGGIKYLYIRKSCYLAYLNDTSEIGDLMKILVKYCHNLVEYRGPFSILYEEINECFLLKLFKACLNLEKLWFWGENQLVNISELVTILSNYVPKRLNTLYMDPLWVIDVDSLDIFLNEHKNLDLDIPFLKTSREEYV
ncbi:3296_t:CDS:1 [Funneliformis geosporum]|uniref:1572_t:CDS:1 n=1 Tax=Funneliformis geosporum TaxID=1117311 RepID=A0A9W4SHG5_9GLOM|nr:3296_t:CDS:1 [Funneliformis geosporum]CAI2168651.1 1572_t:CDS:1 [Funneliformis geosporum]